MLSNGHLKSALFVSSELCSERDSVVNMACDSYRHVARDLSSGLRGGG